MRTKTVQIGNASYEVSPLNLEQVEKFYEESAKTQALPDPNRITDPVEKEQGAIVYLRAIRERVMPVVLAGLNNARLDRQGEPKSGADKEWTRETVLKALDEKTLYDLHGEILAMSGLEIVPRGEAAAAPASTSPTSAAA